VRLERGHPHATETVWAIVTFLTVLALLALIIASVADANQP
jgi:hypothetical protein